MIKEVYCTIVCKLINNLEDITCSHLSGMKHIYSPLNIQKHTSISLSKFK